MPINIENELEESNDFYILKNISIVDKYNFYDYMGMMIDGGVSISDALTSASEKTEKAFFASKIDELKIYIDSGDSFSRSMKKIPSVFNTSEISIIEAGELTGNLSNSFLLISEDLKRIHNLKQKIKSALTYPAIIFVFLIIAIVVVLTYVIPNLVGVFLENGIELPLATKLLLNTSDFFINWYHMIILAIAFIIIIFLLYKSTDSGKKRWSNFLLNIPVIGKIYKNYILTIFASNFGTLINSGVPVIKSLNLTSKSVNNYQYELLVQDMVQEISKGAKITESMEIVDPNHFYFSPDFVQLFSVGEKTASIGKVSKKISDQYILQVDHSLSNLTKWIEPIAILVAGFFVLWFAFAIFGATLTMTQSFNL